MAFQKFSPGSLKAYLKEEAMALIKLRPYSSTPNLVMWSFINLHNTDMVPYFGIVFSIAIMLV